MTEYLPILIVGAIVGLFAGAMILAYVMVKDKKEVMGFDRKMKDGELLKKVLPYTVLYLVIMALIAYFGLPLFESLHLFS